jgi:hypothetical protein
MVFHASTNPVVLAENVFFTEDEVVLEQRFVDYWTSFAINGSPNSGAVPGLEAVVFVLFSAYMVLFVLFLQRLNQTGLCGTLPHVTSWCCKLRTLLFRTLVLHRVRCGILLGMISVVCEVCVDSWELKTAPPRGQVFYPSSHQFPMQPQYGGGQWGYPPQPQPGMYPNTGSPPVGQAGYPGAFPQHQNPGYAHAPVMPDQQPPAVGYPHVVQPAAPTNVDAWIAQNAQGYNPTPAPQQSYGQPATAAGSNTQPKSADTAPAVPQQGPAVVVNARFEAVRSRRGLFGREKPSLMLNCRFRHIFLRFLQSENAKLGLMASIDEIQAKCVTFVWLFVVIGGVYPIPDAK